MEYIKVIGIVFWIKDMFFIFNGNCFEILK